ncbi:helix-turn-helix transcriptional regulator [Paenibacillus ehimensis]|uniref:helix-turn-helix domain-containing protein n=1 Tax=Paenibacillus ehimensis TaxID=79264 RepID=UPI000FDB7A62|nr:helix-turn-helix transcriptional regulator [Paenibacillus ehimensis]
MNIADLIKSKRVKMELSYRELSEKTGVSHTYIRDVETGKYAPSFGNAEKLANVLGIEMEQIVLLTYQAQFRQSLFDLISTCHKYNIKIPYDKWLETSLPLQPLNREDTVIHDFAMSTLNRLHNIADQSELSDRIKLLSELSSLQYNHQIFSCISDILHMITVTLLKSGNNQTEDMLEQISKVLEQYSNEVSNQ